MLSLAGVVLTAACGTTTSSPSASATTPTPATTALTSEHVWSSCPVDEETCTFAEHVEQLIVQGRTTELIAAAPGLPVTCPGVRLQLDGRYPLCEGAVAGEVRYGFAFGRFQSEGGTGDAPSFVRGIDDWLAMIDPRSSDAIGPGTPRVYTIACQLAAGEPQCGGSFAIVLSAILVHNDRELLNLIFADTAAGQPAIVEADTGIVSLNKGYVRGQDRPGGVLPGSTSDVSTRYAPVP